MLVGREIKALAPHDLEELCRIQDYAECADRRRSSSTDRRKRFGIVGVTWDGHPGEMQAFG